MPTLPQVSHREGAGRMRYYIVVSKDGTQPIPSPYFFTYEIDEKFYDEVRRVVVGLVENGRAKGL